jgi:hypothetical protein
VNLPVDFAERPLTISYIRTEELLRLFRGPPSGLPNPLSFGRLALNRFDAPASLDEVTRYGVMYAAFDVATCFAETVTRETNKQPFLNGGIAVSESMQIAPRFVARLSSKTLLRVADVTDIGLYIMGAESGLFNSPNYPVTTQPWSMAIHSRPEQVDGLLYRSRFLNGRRAVAIFDRGAHRIGLVASEVGPLVDHPDYPRVLSDLRILLLP